MSNLLKLRGTDHRTPVTDELVGGVAGVRTEHWDDSVDTLAFLNRPTLFVPREGVLLFPEQRRIIGRLDSEAGKLAMKSTRHPVIAGGAFSVSGLYVDNWIDILDATQLAIDTSLTTHKWAMYTNTLTPDFSADVSYSATNEVSGTGYTAGGQTIVSPTTTESPAGTLMYDMNDQVWAAPTTVTARGAILYADALGTNNLIVAQTFGADFASTAGTFTIQFNALGVFTIDLTP